MLRKVDSKKPLSVLREKSSVATIEGGFLNVVRADAICIELVLCDWI